MRRVRLTSPGRTPIRDGIGAMIISTVAALIVSTDIASQRIVCNSISASTTGGFSGTNYRDGPGGCGWPGNGYRLSMSIIRHDDGSLTVPVAVPPDRHGDEAIEDDDTNADVVLETGTLVIRPGEGGYIEALAEWEADQHPDRGEAVSTASGRSQAMAAVRAMAEDPADAVGAVDAMEDRGSAAEALRHVLVGGTPSVEAFASEVAEAEGGESVAAHTVTSIIGEVLAEIDKRSD